MKIRKVVSALTLSIAGVGIVMPVVAQEVLDEVVVTGIRSSLEAAADLKRSDSRIIDVIVAEDIGKLPDNNIAEALQRITGVSINRDFGVGSGVSIRGLPQNRIELNGRSTIGTGDGSGPGANTGNGINFQDFPSQLLSGIEVIKSPTPKSVEGALGGTINLKTLRPSELDERVISISARGEYADKADNLAPILNAFYGDNWTLEGGSTFGVIANIAYQNRELHLDEYRNGYDTRKYCEGPNSADNTVVNVDADCPATSTSDRLVLRPDNFTYFPAIEERKRIAGNVSLEWVPAPELGRFYAEATMIDRSGSDLSFSPLTINESPLGSDAERMAGHRIDDQSVITGTTDVIGIQTSTESLFRETESFSGAFGGEWTFVDKLDVSGELSYSSAKTTRPDNDLRFRGVDANGSDLSTSVFFDTDHSNVPTVRLIDDPEFFTTEGNFALRRLDQDIRSSKNDELAYRFDVAYANPFESIGFEPLKAISSFDAGVRYTDQSFEYSRMQFRVANIHRGLTLNDAETSGLVDDDGNPIATPRDVIFISDFPDEVITVHDFSGGFSGFGNNDFDLTRFLGPTADLLRDTERTRQVIADLLVGTNREGEASLVDRTGDFFAADVKVTAFYFQFEIDTEVFGKPLRSVVGSRYVDTDIQIQLLGDDTATPDVDEGALNPITGSNKYSDWLPSLNISLDLFENTVLRFAYANVLRRPEFGDINPILEFNGNLTSATGGDPQLSPFRATQYDISFEQYWGDSNLFSFSLFYKDVESFFTTSTTCESYPDFVANVFRTNTEVEQLCLLDQTDGTVTAATGQSLVGIDTTIQTNGESGFVTGIEVGYQQSFDFLPGVWSGLGVNMNYTYADSEDQDGVPLEDISKNTFNLQGYYEKYGFGLRVAYTYRSRFLDETDASRIRGAGNNGNSFRDPIEQWDISAFYHINDRITVSADVVNLTEEGTVDTETNGAVYQIRQADRRFSLGVNVSF